MSILHEHQGWQAVGWGGQCWALGTLRGCFWVLLLSMAIAVTFLPGTALTPVAVRDRAMVSGQSSAAVSVLQDPDPCSVPVPALPASGAVVWGHSWCLQSPTLTTASLLLFQSALSSVRAVPEVVTCALSSMGA